MQILYRGTILLAVLFQPSGSHFKTQLVATFVLMENIMLYNDAVLLTMLYIESSIIIFFMVTTE